MTTEIKQLSEKLAQMYGVAAKTEYQELGLVIWLAEDSGRISDLADDNGIDVKYYHSGKDGGVKAYTQNLYFTESFNQYPTKHDAARMARVRCLLAIGEK